MAKTRGFTLVELMVVIAVMSILLALAVPSFGRLIQSSGVSSDVNTFLADMRYARGEAVRRGSLVLMCPSTNPEDANADCGTDPDWKNGWIIFEDRDNSGSHAAAEPMLRQQGPLTRSGGVVDGGGTVTKFHFLATGRMRSINDAATLTFNPASGNSDATLQRVVCVSMSGRARIAGDGSTSCS